ncbi:MAG: glycosyltransferase family 4 protein [Bacteroidia bacterium]|nr:glycosyltransferase family 4 protein [Bacteroidia bacterium]
MTGQRNIKLFIDAHCFDREHQGTRAFIKRIYYELHRIAPNIEFYFAAQDTDNIRKEFAGIKNCKFIRYRSGRSWFRLLVEVPWIIHRYKIDIAHFQYIVPFIKNCRFIVTTHDVIFKQYKNEFSFFYRLSRSSLFGVSLRRSEIITTVSEYSKRTIQKHFNVSEDKLLVTSNGLNPDYSNHPGSPDSRSHVSKKYGLGNYILYVSRFEPRKNHQILLRAYHELDLAAAGYDLVLLGHKSIRTPDFEKYLRNLPEKLRNRVFISDATNDEDLYHFYKAASLFVYPSKAEGFGLPPIEAAALQIPVVCSNLTAMSEYTFFGKNHIDPTQINLLKERITDILNSPPKREELETISAEVRKRYDARMAAGVLNDAIQKLFR